MLKKYLCERKRKKGKRNFTDVGVNSYYLKLVPNEIFRLEYRIRCEFFQWNKAIANVTCRNISYYSPDKFRFNSEFKSEYLT